MSDQTPRPVDASLTETEDLDTEGHAANWKVVVDPQTGNRRIRQEWTADEPPASGTAGRVTSPRRPTAR